MSKFYRNSKGFFTNLIKGNGLYWTMGATAVVVVSLAALLLVPQEPTQETVAPPNTEQVHQSSGEITDSPTDLFSSQTESDVSADETEDGAGDGAVMMILPVSGTVGTDFSLTVPVFSETMQDWRVHQGIDFLTEGEVDVVAAADGIVDQVYFDELMGMTVEILHADGTISVYQSLGEEVAVIAGQEVRRGDLLGKSGTSADSESLEGHHLHFALICAGVYLDPNDRFTS